MCPCASFYCWIPSASWTSMSSGHNAYRDEIAWSSNCPWDDTGLCWIWCVVAFEETKGLLSSSDITTCLRCRSNITACFPSWSGVTTSLLAVVPHWDIPLVLDLLYFMVYMWPCSQWECCIVEKLPGSMKLLLARIAVMASRERSWEKELFEGGFMVLKISKLKNTSLDER